MYVCVCIYIYIEREIRYTYICIYTHICTHVVCSSNCSMTLSIIHLHAIRLMMLSDFTNSYLPYSTPL